VLGEERRPRVQWQCLGELGARADAELGKDLAEVVLELAAADVFTESTTFWVMESIRLDLGYGSQVHP
jgi:hypothetical protein